MDLTQIDRHTQFLRGMSDVSLASVLELAQLRTFAPGVELFAEGATHKDLHLLIQGHVRLDMRVPNRGRTPLLTVGPGDVLAWSALLSTGTMTTSALALDHVRTAAIDGAALKRLCDQRPDVGYHVMKQLAAALSSRLVATRLQLLDLFSGHEPVLESFPVSERL